MNYLVVVMRLYEGQDDWCVFQKEFMKEEDAEDYAKGWYNIECKECNVRIYKLVKSFN